MPESATAFAPGHVTAFFSIHREPDPSKMGSQGVGITLTDGVRVRLTPAEDTTVWVNDDPTVIEPVKALLRTLEKAAHVDIQTPLELGAGFGVSGAATLATALAANQVFDLNEMENTLIDLAHREEVKAETGLGDVVAQARGGVPVRLEPGGPDHNLLDGIPASGRVEYLTHGNIDTKAILSGTADQLNRAGDAALSELLAEPKLSTVFEQGRRFATDADLLTEPVARTIDQVQETGGEAMMAMLGQSVIAIDDGLTAAGFDPAVCHISQRSARLQ